MTDTPKTIWATPWDEGEDCGAYCPPAPHMKGGPPNGDAVEYTRSDLSPQWKTDFDDVPENTPLLVELKNDNSGNKRYSVLLYWDFGGEGEFAWMTTDDMSQIDHWNWTPTKWMHLPTP